MMMYDDVFRQPHVHLEDTEQNIEFRQEGHVDSFFLTHLETETERSSNAGFPLLK